ncbi:tRNA (guanosine(37)-N1)-methyltransferase TrmD [Garciella nitratireducens]|uniref:tRNA (guanine-N(1)-)-methyltransferase n=1 Tax=Garciella nitratireducens DSM 15102 TaxID=1121911 RepID=A0A1T4JXS1_9FIRM|nr:tRNA (guanosine(37)-N1)-methyltransferase TrmD [Garciella nitratireducens]SJZ34953.1 tRNA (guanine37-N1)-methyltransferase [Garciella nitratireducens DSM 15102]
MRIDVLTLFPELFETFKRTSIIKRGIDRKIIDIHIKNIRDYSLDKHKKTDDYPYGGGPGMIMTPQPIYDCYQDIEKVSSNPPCIYLTPQGNIFNQEMAMELSKYPQIIFLCGHYEGIDERIIQNIVTHEISIGDYVLTGGELPAMVMIDCISRLLPGMLGNSNSCREDSISSGLLEFPQYTRPYDFLGKKVPDILLSGDHKKIEKWRKFQALLKTKKRRPDLFYKYSLSEEEKKILEEYDKNK